MSEYVLTMADMQVYTRCLDRWGPRVTLRRTSYDNLLFGHTGHLRTFSASVEKQHIPNCTFHPLYSSKCSRTTPVLATLVLPHLDCSNRLDVLVGTVGRDWKSRIDIRWIVGGSVVGI